jgi:uncharacterized membrane protein
MSTPSPRGGGPTGPQRAEAAAVEVAIARLLATGSGVAIVLLAIGSLLLVAGGTSPLAPDWPPLDVTTIPADLLALRPEGFLWLGLIVTIATPLLRVGAAVVGFARLGERRMVALGLAVLVVVGLAVVAGTAGG